MRKNGRKLKEKKMTGLRRSGYKHSRQFFSGPGVIRSGGTEEEELLVWSLTCLQAPLNNQAYERYKELFCRLLPEKAKILFPEMNENNQAKVA